MRQPEYLKKGDAIIMIAPSFGVTTEPYKTRYEAACINLKKLGYRILEGENVHKNEGIASSASPLDRAKEFMDAYESEAKLILSVGGGELMCEILPHIDFEKIKSLPPKWFMGFSDNSNLTFTLSVLSDLVTIYGPNAPTFFEKPLRLEQLDALKMLTGEKEFKGYPKWDKPSSKKKPEKDKSIDPLRKCRYMGKKIITAHNYQGPFEGVLLGGCLDCLTYNVGSKYDAVTAFNKKHPEGVVWYFEACELEPISIRRALLRLKEAGWFAATKGFLVGRPLCWDREQMGVNRINAVVDILGDLNVPILMDVDLGHYSPSMPMKNGVFAKISYDGENIFITYKG